jgi:hypothetical protein
MSRGFSCSHCTLLLEKGLFRHVRCTLDGHSVTIGGSRHAKQGQLFTAQSGSFGKFSFAILQELANGTVAF